MIEARVRWLRGSGDWQTGQSQPMTGMPTEVPVPRKVISSGVAIDSGAKTCIMGPTSQNEC